MKYLVELDREQMKIIARALDEYVRLRMNQWRDFASSVAFLGFEYDEFREGNTEEFGIRVERRNRVEELFEEAMKAVNPEIYNSDSVSKTSDMRLADDTALSIMHWMKFGCEKPSREKDGGENGEKL